MCRKASGNFTLEPEEYAKQLIRMEEMKLRVDLQR
jgi:hypothetical protein